MSTIAETMKKLRVRRQRTQRECAESVGVDAKTWGRWERGEVEPPAATIPAIASALDVTVARLQGEQEDTGADALRAIHAVAALYELVESDLSPERLKYLRSMITGLVGMVEIEGFGGQPEVKASDPGKAAQAVLAELTKRLTSA